MSQTKSKLIPLLRSAAIAAVTCVAAAQLLATPAAAQGRYGDPNAYIDYGAQGYVPYAAQAYSGNGYGYGYTQGQDDSGYTRDRDGHGRRGEDYGRQVRGEQNRQGYSGWGDAGWRNDQSQSYDRGNGAWRDHHNDDQEADQ